MIEVCFFNSITSSSVIGSLSLFPVAMKTHHHHPKLKPPPRQFFSCGFFRHCTQTVLSPTTPHAPSLPPPQSDTPLPLPPPPSSQPPSLPPPPHHPDSSSTSSSSTSQSFTQWRFPLPSSPLLHHQQPYEPPPPPSELDPVLSANLQELFHVCELQLTIGSETDSLAALYHLERSLVPNPQPDLVCPSELMRGIVMHLRNQAGAKSATKILFALCLGEQNRHVAVEVGAVGGVVEVVAEMECPAAERALAALELMCTVPEGAAELRAHALAVPVMVEMMGRLEGLRGKEYAISVLAVLYSGETPLVTAPPEEVARAVELALRGECSARGRRKGQQLLKVLQESECLDLTQEET